MAVGLVTLCAALVAGAIVAPESATAEPFRDTTITGVAFAAQLASGQPFDAQNAVIIGDVVLPLATSVPKPVRCVSCRIDGNLVAPNVSFGDLVDLAGTRVTGAIDLRSATFARSLVWTDGTAGSDADFSGAEFKGGAAFSNTDFLGRTDFSRAAFGGTAVFSGRPGPGQSAAPSSVSTCDHPDLGLHATTGTFGDVTFQWAVFRDIADFRGRCFARGVDMSFVSISRAADFSTAQFAGVGRFPDANFGDQVSFALATVRDDLLLQRVKVSQDLLFDLADLGSGTVYLTDARVGGKLSFASVPFATALQMDGVSEGIIDLDPARIGWVLGRPTKIKILQDIENANRRQGDASKASDARYAWLSLSGEQTEDRPFWYPFADHVMYKDVFGYLAYPSRPVLVLLLLLLIGTMVRMAMILTTGRRQRLAAPVTARRSAAMRTLDAFLLGASRTISRAVRKATPTASGTKDSADPKRSGDNTTPSDANTPSEPMTPGQHLAAFLRWAEYLSVKGLLAIAVLTIANSNQTFHEFLEAAINR
jgi:hypothetical protein